MGHGLCIGRSFGGAPSGREPIINRLLGLPGLGMMVSEQFRFGHCTVGEALLEYLCDPGMQLLTLALEQPSVSGVLNERVLEGVYGVRRPTAAEDELGARKLAQCVL